MNRTAVRSKLLLKASRHTEHAAKVADVFAKDDDVGVSLKLVSEGGVERCNHVHFRHVLTSLPKFLSLLLNVPGNGFVDFGKDG